MKYQTYPKGISWRCREVQGH